MKISPEGLRKLLHLFLIPLFAVLLLVFALILAFTGHNENSYITIFGISILVLGIIIKLIREKLKKLEI